MAACACSAPASVRRTSTRSAFPMTMPAGSAASSPAGLPDRAHMRRTTGASATARATTSRGRCRHTSASGTRPRIRAGGSMSKGKLAVVVVLAAVVIAFFALGGHHYLTRDYFDAQRAALESAVQARPVASKLMFFAVYVIVTGASLPGA